MSLAGTVRDAASARQKDVNNVNSQNEEGILGPPLRPSGVDGTPKRSPGSYFRSLSDSPSMRTGPPRSLSYPLSSSPSLSRENPDLMSPDGVSKLPLVSPNDFRSALEYEPTDKKEKKRESRTGDESWSPMKWFQDSSKDSPREEKQGLDFDTHDSGERTPRAATSQTPINRSARIGITNHLKVSSRNESSSRPGASPSHKFSTSPSALKFPNLRRAKTGSDPNPDTRPGRDGNRWSMIRSLIPNIINQQREATQLGPSTISQQVSITDELITGGLATLMLRLWFERDEKDHRRVPVLLHRLRIRVSDSLHPLHGSKSVFRIECEYANGAVRWVIYRQLRDFISLHTHYTVTNVYKRNVDKMPEFPRTSTSSINCLIFFHCTASGLPYFKFLKREGRDVSQTDFARLQRESLENYLVQLIRAVVSIMFVLRDLEIFKPFPDVPPVFESLGWVS